MDHDCAGHRTTRLLVTNSTHVSPKRMSTTRVAIAAAPPSIMESMRSGACLIWCGNMLLMRVTPIRETFTDYNLSQAYLDRRIIGLVSAVHVTNVSSVGRARLVYSYDNPSQLQGLPAAATQHDTSYSTFIHYARQRNRGSRWDVTDITNPAKALTTQMRYNTTGAVVATIDPAGHENIIIYDDSFSDNAQSQHLRVSNRVH